MRFSRQFRRGLSITEAVVATVLAVLLAILVPPAVERARESALGNRSRENLRRIGVGMYAYHAAQNSLPH